MEQSHGSAKSLHRLKVLSLAMALTTGGDVMMAPLFGSRHRQDVRSNLKPSTWYSSTQCLKLSSTKFVTGSWLQLNVLPHPV